MKMQYHHSGRQFFFITLTMEERTNVLSQLEDEQARPRLTVKGETVKSALLALHTLFSCATVSDFVIMPDHIHFLLIVNYGVDPVFNPLWVTHRLMDAVETVWNGRGSLPEPLAPADMAAVIRQADTLAREKLGKLSVAGSGGAAPVHSLRWNRHCHIVLSFNPRQLKAIRRYIRLNPARTLWKKANPDRFIRHSGIRHPVLNPNYVWSAMGNLTLLTSPFLLHVRLTLRKTAEEHATEIDSLMDRVRKGAIPVCGFLSPGEKELLRQLKREPGSRFIKMVPAFLPPRYDPSAEDSRELAADRLLILTAFPPNTPDTIDTLRARCQQMNALAATLCEKAQTLSI